MTLFHHAFSMLGVVTVLVVSFFALFIFIMMSLVEERKIKKKIIIGIAVFVIIQVLSFTILMSDFPQPSRVDLSPLEAANGAAITNFEGNRANLSNSVYFKQFSKSKYTYGYVYTYDYGMNESVVMSIFVMDDFAEAWENMLIASGVKESQISKISENVYAYRSKSKMWRDEMTFEYGSSYFDKNLSRMVDTFIVIDNYLFILREKAERAHTGNLSSIVVKLVCDTFF